MRMIPRNGQIRGHIVARAGEMKIERVDATGIMGENPEVDSSLRHKVPRSNAEVRDGGIKFTKSSDIFKEVCESQEGAVVLAGR